MAQTAVVVGVGNGLGTALFERLASSGTATIICSNQTEETRAVGRDLRDAGHDALSLACDPADPVDLAEAFAEALSVFDIIDLVVFTAGATSSGGLVDLSRGPFIDALHRDVLGGFCTARAFVPRMQEWGAGTLLFVSGSAALQGIGGEVGPSSTQAGLRGLAASIREEFDGRIAVSHVAVEREGQPETIAAEIVGLLEDTPELDRSYRVPVS